MTGIRIEQLRVAGVTLELRRCGAGPAVLFLHPETGLRGSEQAFQAIAGGASVIMPTHPGFGDEPAPPGIDTIDDLAYLYLDLIETLSIDKVTLVGVALGAWIAAEMAVRSTDRIAGLVLAGPVGIKVGPRDTGDVADMFMLSDDEYRRLAYADPDCALFDPAAHDLAEVRAEARAYEAAARYAWSPYMFHPKLAQRLRRIRRPTLILQGDHDRVTSPDYALVFAESIAGSSYVTMAGAGHYPHAEQPEAFGQAIRDFLQTAPAASGPA